MFYQVECFLKIHKHTANRVMWIKACHDDDDDDDDDAQICEARPK